MAARPTDLKHIGGNWFTRSGYPGVIARKKVDESIFKVGTTIPKTLETAFREANHGQDAPLGGHLDVVLLIGDDRYPARLQRPKGRPVLQLRWDDKNLLQLLRTVFAATFATIPADTEAEPLSSQAPATTIGDDPEYIDIHSSDAPLVYRLELIPTGVKGSAKRSPGSSDRGLMNVAFKLTWVQGKDGPWSTPCTPEWRRVNIRNQKKVWCSQEACPCRKLVDGEDVLPANTDPCMDYRAPRDFRFDSGTFHNGPRAGQSQSMRRTAVGKWAFLTSRQYPKPEEDRVLIACFRIDHFGLCEGYNDQTVWADPTSPDRLVVPPDRLADAPRFWNLHKAKKGPAWGTGLFRYISDHEAEAMRAAIAATCEGINPTVWGDIEAKRLEDEYFEGQRSTRLVSHYERNPSLRSAAIEKHGTSCQVCGMDFSKRYGELGAGFIEVHHLKPVADYEGEVSVDPETDMAVACPNCHRMLHRRKDGPLSLEELREILLRQSDL